MWSLVWKMLLNTAGSMEWCICLADIQTGLSMLCVLVCCFQADGTLEELLSDEAVLQRLLAPLGGGSSPQQQQQQQQQTNSSSNGENAAAQEANGTAANGVHEQLEELSINGSSGSNGSSAAKAAGSSSSSSSWRDPDDGVRESLAEAIAVLVRHRLVLGDRQTWAQGGGVPEWALGGGGQGGGELSASIRWQAACIVSK